MSSLTELETKHVKDFLESEKKEALNKAIKILKTRCRILEGLTKHGKCYVCEPDDYNRVIGVVSSNFPTFAIPRHCLSLDKFVSHMLNDPNYPFKIQYAISRMEGCAGFYILF